MIRQKAADAADGSITVFNRWPSVDPTLYMLPWAHPSPQPKRHLDRFSRFRRAYDCDRPTDRPRYSVCSNRPHLYARWRSPADVAAVAVVRQVPVPVMPRHGVSSRRHSAVLTASSFEHARLSPAPNSSHSPAASRRWTFPVPRRLEAEDRLG